MSPSSSSQDWRQWATTQDGMFKRRVLFTQHRKGYRFSIDAVLLSDFAAQGQVGSALDLGCGCGVVLLLLATLWKHKGAQPKMLGLEKQESLVALAHQNVKQNGFEGQVDILQYDLRTPTTSPDYLQSKWDLLTFNPPYFYPQKGRMSPQPERAAARHELHGNLEELITQSATFLQEDGRFALVYPHSGLQRLEKVLSQANLHVSRKRYVYPGPGEAPKLILLEAQKHPQATQVEEPLILHKSPQVYSEEAELILQGRGLPILSESLDK